MNEPAGNAESAGAQELTDDELAFLESVFDLARGGHTDELAPLLEAGIPANLTNAKGDSLLILASYHERGDTVELLLGAGADPNRVNDMGQTALTCATFRRNVPIVQQLLDAGGDPALGAVHAVGVAEQFGAAEISALFANR